MCSPRDRPALVAVRRHVSQFILKSQRGQWVWEADTRWSLTRCQADNNGRPYCTLTRGAKKYGSENETDSCTVGLLFEWKYRKRTYRMSDLHAYWTLECSMCFWSRTTWYPLKWFKGNDSHKSNFIMAVQLGWRELNLYIQNYSAMAIQTVLVAEVVPENQTEVQNACLFQWI